MSNLTPDVSSIKGNLKNLPNQPGVYLMLDDRGKVIYVGKASNLKRRISSYFRKNIPDPKTRRLVAKIKSFDYEIHSSEEAAIIRERELIRTYSPRFNFQFMDDKEYPMIRITALSDEEPFSRLFIVRSADFPNDYYFGRKTDVKALRDSVRSLRKIFPVANKTYCFRTKKPCLDFSINRCTAPCVEKISKIDYQRIVNQLILFLQGKRKDLIEVLYKEMNQASNNMEFELAAKIRDRIVHIEKTIDSQKGFPQPRDRDILILIEDSNFYMLINFWIRDNQIINSEEKFLGRIETLPESEILTSFITNYYLSSDFIPSEIEVSSELYDDGEILEMWLSKKRGTGVKIIPNPKIISSSIFKLQVRRLNLELGEKVRSIQKKQQVTEKALQELKDYLQLVHLPRRIETYDISNIQGAFPVGSMVVFNDGSPMKSEYRRFKIKTVKPEPNDVAMLQEVLSRRLLKEDPKFAQRLPDLLVIDGGKPQVNAIYGILKRLKKNIPVIGLAKREEEVFFPLEKDPILIQKDSAALRLLQQCRDEAHRFAVTYHKKRRISQSKTELDDIPGVGEKRRNALLRYFGDINQIKSASVDQLCNVEGINRALAEKIHLYFVTNQKA
ncbi:MAG: excinuclease ABC subunit UvrC [Candidatus Hodarchaeales archaeon]|jgi:excinuclease ABC subunit C